MKSQIEQAIGDEARLLEEVDVAPANVPLVTDFDPASPVLALDTDTEHDYDVSYDEWSRLFPDRSDVPHVYKHDIYNLVTKGVLGLGIGAQVVHVDIKSGGFTSPYFIVIPLGLSLVTSVHGVLENLPSDWQKHHATAMRGYTYFIAGVKIIGLESFNKSLLNSWAGNTNSLEMKIGGTFVALGMCVPFIILAESDNISKIQRLPARVRGCLSHKATKKVIAVISNGINANAGMSSILGFVAAFNVLPTPDFGSICANMTNCTQFANITFSNSTGTILITPFQVNLVSGMVGVGNMAVEALTVWQHPLVGLTNYAAGAVRIVVTAGAMGTSIVSLGFAATSGFMGGRVPMPAVLSIGIGAASVIAFATGYRLVNYLRTPEVNVEKDGEARDVMRSIAEPVHPVSRASRFFRDCCGRRQKDELPLLEDKGKESRCTIL